MLGWDVTSEETLDLQSIQAVSKVNFYLKFQVKFPDFGCNILAI